MAKFILYHTDGCHLCDQAYDLILQVIPEEGIERKDIVSSEILMSRYQTIIPVLERQGDEQQIKWPFDVNQIQQLVE